jgi:RNA polymerase sigma-70 factor, ECF subfamily
VGTSTIDRLVEESDMVDSTTKLQELVDRLRGGDPSALAGLFSHYRERLRRMIDLRLDQRLGGRVSASDVLQETFLDATKRAAHFARKPDLPFYLWLRMVAGQRVAEVHRQHLRAQMRSKGHEVSIDGPCMGAASVTCLAAQLVGRVNSPSHAARRNETLKQVEQALEGLDPMDREVLVLRHFEDLSNNEVAQLLGIQKAAASKRYVRALQRLREALAGIPDFADP